PNFDKMMGNITGNTEPSVDLGNRQVVPDRKTHELTYKIFLALRDFDDPYVTEKFREFMERTLGPLDDPINP
ncbi:MAG TPA: hypothetical protein VIY47_02910, partial [Ignavibacteriaceae bacterium]